MWLSHSLQNGLAVPVEKHAYKFKNDKEDYCTQGSTDNSCSEADKEVGPVSLKLIIKGTSHSDVSEAVEEALTQATTNKEPTELKLKPKEIVKNQEKLSGIAVMALVGKSAELKEWKQIGWVPKELVSSVYQGCTKCGCDVKDLHVKWVAGKKLIWITVLRK